jgi:hypothetical protein
MTEGPRLDWESIVARVNPPPPPEETPPPPTVTRRVLERWHQWRHDAQVRRWARWALGAALAAAILCAAAWIYRQLTDTTPLLPPPPAPQLPSPPALPPPPSPTKLPPPPR